jgi:hypothetical protein
MWANWTRWASQRTSMREPPHSTLEGIMLPPITSSATSAPLLLMPMVVLAAQLSVLL